MEIKELTEYVLRKRCSDICDGEMKHLGGSFFNTSVTMYDHVCSRCKEHKILTKRYPQFAPPGIRTNGVYFVKERKDIWE